jgi:hypothetical protein
MKLIALCTIVAGKPGAEVRVPPGEEFDIPDRAEAERLVAGGHANWPDKKAAAKTDTNAAGQGAVAQSATKGGTTP